MADLHPVVIPPLNYTFKTAKFTCKGEGLLIHGFHYDPHPEKHLPPREATSVLKAFEKKPQAYWKAQCAFRGLNQKGTVGDLQARVRGARKSILPELEAAEKEMNAEFINKNKFARDAGWTEQNATYRRFMEVSPSTEVNVKFEDNFDVRGSWALKCPEIEEQWNDHAYYAAPKLDLYLERKRGELQLYGMFNLRIIEGIMRFERPMLKATTDTTVFPKKRKFESVHNQTILQDIPAPNSGKSERPKGRAKSGYNQNVFFLYANDRPSTECPTWQYRWRGSECGEGTVEPGSDKAHPNTITFSNNGTELSGTFSCDEIQNCQFTGVKTHPHAPKSKIDPDCEWDDYLY